MSKMQTGTRLRQLTLFGPRRRVSPPVLGAKCTGHGSGACAAGGDAPPVATRRKKLRQLTCLVLFGFAVAADGQTLTGPALIKSLQAGGHVIVMRHASSPRDVPPNPNPDNVPPERQLDEKGRSTATAMGDALRRLKIPIGEALTSPTYRARETARLARLPNPRPATELGEGPQSMQGAVAPAQTEWLQKKVKEFPKGTNTVLITHVPNITAAFPGETPAAVEGEAFVFGSDGKGGARLVGRIKIEEWTSF